MVYGRYNELVNGVYKPTYNWGAPSCRLLIGNIIQKWKNHPEMEAFWGKSSINRELQDPNYIK